MERVNILLESVGRNTAPATALAALQVCAEADDPILLVLAADHVIGDVPAFQASIHVAFVVCPEDSIDYAVMEKTADAVMVSLDAGWSDIGSWSALWDISEKDEQGNVFKGDVLDQHSRNTYAHANSRLIATVGVKHLVIIETKDAVLVAH